MDVIGQYLPTKDQVQIRFMPNKTLVNKMLGSLNPNGRDLVIDGCDSIRRRVRSEVPGVAKKNLKELTDAGALDVMIDVLKLWMEDAPVSGRCDLGVLKCCDAFTLLCDSCPSHDDVGGFFFDFELFRTASGPSRRVRETAVASMASSRDIAATTPSS